MRWEELPEALAPGGEGDPDSDGIWTGSVIRAGGELHIFYTGHTLEGDIPQSVCHATSADGITWVKDPANPVSVPDPGQVRGQGLARPVRVLERGRAALLDAAHRRSAAHPAVSRGVVVMQTSADLLPGASRRAL